MKTGADGKYEFRTIKPEHNIQIILPLLMFRDICETGFPEYTIIYYFECDNLITAKNRSGLNSHRGGTPSIIKLTKDSNGNLIGTGI
jgi:hypothetical protein